MNLHLWNGNRGNRIAQCIGIVRKGSGIEDYPVKFRAGGMYPVDKIALVI